MNEPLTQALTWLAGGVLGTIYFGGLWWTVRQGLSSSQPALLFLGSLLVRMGVALTGFYFVADGHWLRLLVCLLGFVTARVVVTHWVRSPADDTKHRTKETHHAS